MTFQCALNTRLKKIVVVAAKSKQYFPLIKWCGVDGGCTALDGGYELI